ncbi:hypothetical protein [Hymenobacter chitinivorans]|uniref:Uncharacterized protein n=1 Tax=Hymenobacter chitinivorans DSM 11115 TaxID=1121954 RepID=A0A2M9BTM5_9BACT|nr:hypothetical protein [Hymenobacter chitinivorans]PJJ61262.1 hypothetical protein CLV45_2700 [Hymenobacter chitinivorans DSM 11115]
MRFFYVALGLLLPQVAAAQFNSFQPGSYVLSSDQTVHAAPKLKLRGSDELVVKNAAGQTAQFTPSDVSSFRLGRRKYVSVGSFYVSLGLGGESVEDAFVELLDSGSVQLLRYDVSFNRPMTMSPAGGMSGGGSTSYATFLLRRANERTLKQIPGNRLTGGGTKFRDAILPYLTQRPDLIKLVEDKTVTLDNIVGLIHALNTGQPYAITAPYNYYN